MRYTEYTEYTDRASRWRGGRARQRGTVFTPILLSPPSLAPTFRSPSSMRHLEFPAALQDNCQFEGPDRERERKRERELH
jgi:hypothetical protein